MVATVPLRLNIRTDHGHEGRCEVAGDGEQGAVVEYATIVDKARFQEFLLNIWQ